MLGLEDEELLRVLGSDALSVITGEEDLRPEVKILLELLREPEETLGVLAERGWVIRGRGGAPPATPR